MKPGLEAELAVLCAAPWFHAARVRELLDRNPDWDELLGFVSDHRLQQVFAWRMREARPGVLPPAFAKAFEDTLRSSLQLTRELTRVIDLFRAAGIDALPFKGPVLALEAYGNLALRSFDDLDILVRREDVWRARDVLRAGGYQPKLELNPARETDFLNAYDEYLMRGPGGSPLVELHWAFVPPHFGVGLDFEECWRKHGSVRLANRELPALAAEDLLLVLSVHGAKHGWSYLGLVTDVAWLVAARPPEWERLLERARALGVLRMAVLAPALAAHVFGMELAEPLRRAIAADPAVPVLVREIADALFGLNGRKRHDEKAILGSAKLHMRMRERWADRIRYGARLATRAGIEDWQAIDLPAPLAFLYPVLRFPRLAMKYRSRVP